MFKNIFIVCTLKTVFADGFLQVTCDLCCDVCSLLGQCEMSVPARVSPPLAPPPVSPELSLDFAFPVSVCDRRAAVMTSLGSLVTALLSLVLNTVIAEVTEAEQVQDSLEAYMNLDQVETVEGFMRTREFKVSFAQNTGRDNCGKHGLIFFERILKFFQDFHTHQSSTKNYNYLFPTDSI